MALAISSESRRYVLKEEEQLPVESQSVFLIRPLTGRQRAKLRDMQRYADPPRFATFNGKDGKPFQFPIPENSDEIAYERVSLGLVGWENFKYLSGGECPFTDKQEQNLDKLEDALLQELSFAIEALSIVTEEEAGNSSSPPSGLKGSKKSRKRT